MKKLKQIEVEWVDSWSAEMGWENIEDLEMNEPLHIITTGYEYCQTEHYIVVIGSYNASQMLGRIMIPKVAIVATRYLKEQSHELD